MGKGLKGTYSSKEVIITFGTHIVTGLADDSFITIEKNGDGFSTYVGADGEVVRSADPDPTSTITLSLRWLSPSNKYLEQKHAKDRDTLDDTFSVTISDLRGNTKFTCEDAWVVKSTNREYGKASGACEWQIATGDGELSDN